MTTTVYRASLVRTLSTPAAGEWVLVDGRHVQRVGSGDPPLADRVVDLPGATIVPGFIDAHVHLTSTGLAMEQTEVEVTRSASELIELATRRAEGRSGAVVAMQGYDESRWTDRRLPAAAALDAVTPDPLVIRRIDGHVALLNRAAMLAAEVDGVEGCLLDDAGIVTGVVNGEANRRVMRWLAEQREPHRIEELQLNACAEAAARGVTTVHEMAMPEEAGFRDVEVLLGHEGRLPVDVVPIVASMDVARVFSLGVRSIGGDLAVDGSIGARTAAVNAPYVDGGQGQTTFADDVLAAFFHDGHDAGLQVGVHAIGDRAIEQVLATWERVYATLDSRERRHFRARRHRVEHIEMPTPAQVERAAMLGLAASVQPAFDARWGGPGGLYEQALGAEHSAGMNPFRLMLERGLVVGAGSDTPVTPSDPWGAVDAMMRHHDVEQRLDLERAFRVHTVGGAMLAHQENKKGMLAPGFHADMAAYDGDPFATVDLWPPRPTLTVSLGREVFAR